MIDNNGIRTVACAIWLASLSLCGSIDWTTTAAYTASHEGTVVRWTHLSSRQGDLPAPSQSVEQTASLVLDIDGDRDNDIVIACRKTPGPSVVWYRRHDDGWQTLLIEDEPLDIEAGGAFADIDGDGDLDVAFGGDSQSAEIWWWENPAPVYDAKNGWPRHSIKRRGNTQHHDMLFGDFDGDGTLSLAYWNQQPIRDGNRLFIADVPADPRSALEWPAYEIFSGGSERCEGLALSDIDGDGLNDIVGAGRWFKFAGGREFEPNVIDVSMSWTRVAVGQLVADGKPEVVFSSGDQKGPLRWYAWDGGRWAGHDLLTFDIVRGHTLDIADIDGDGALDIFSAEMRLRRSDKARAWLFFGNGQGTFEPSILSSGVGNHESRLADLDADGDVDILGKPYRWGTPSIDVWLNEGAEARGGIFGAHWRRHVIDRDKPWRSIFVDSADIDADGDADLVTGGWWYRNEDTIESPWVRTSIGKPLHNMAAVHDLDGDGDLDVIGTQGKGARANADFAWGENDGRGAFTIHQNIPSREGDFLQGVAVLQWQGAIAIACSWHRPGQGVWILHVPAEPATTAWTWEKIWDYSEDEDLSAADLDSDGDDDLILGTIWLENRDGAWRPNVLHRTTDPPDRNEAVDLDGDGTLDVAIGFEAASTLGTLAWYRATTDVRAVWEERPIARVIGPMSLDVADVDRDGDVDVVVGEHNKVDPASSRLFVIENSDGAGGRWNQHVIGRGDEHHDGTRTADVDGDGDLDIVSIGWTHGRVLVYENPLFDGVSPSLQR